jgi:hypothetical protein
MSHTSSRLSSVDRDFIVIEKPFPLAIGVAVDLHQAALTRRAEDLDDGPDLDCTLLTGPLGTDASPIWCKLFSRGGAP